MLVINYEEKELKLRVCLAFLFSLVFFIAMPYLLNVVHSVYCEVASIISTGDSLNCNKK